MLIKKRKLSTLRTVSSVKTVHAGETTRAIELEIHKAKQEANFIRQEAEKVLAESQRKLKEAEEKVKEIIRTTNLEAKTLKEQVYNETLNAATVEAEQIKNNAKEILKELFEVKVKALNQAHSDIINIALDLAKKIIRYEASVDPNVLKVQVVEAIKRATPDTDRVQVYVNPSELAKLQESIPELEKLFPRGINIIPLAKESVDPGSCIVETKSGQLDASFSTQLGVLTNLIANIEVKEPEIYFEEEIPVDTGQSQTVLFEESETALPLVEEEVYFTFEEAKLKSELLNDEPLIQMPKQVETFPFSKENKPEEATVFDAVDEEVLEVPHEIISEAIDVKAEPPAPTKKKIDLGNTFERTREEAEELDKESVIPEQKIEPQIEVSQPQFEYEEDDELPEEKEKKPVIKSILRPKKKAPSQQISEIASEIEKSPEWKDLVQGEDEE